jgi:phosphoglycolate phosphatase
MSARAGYAGAEVNVAWQFGRPRGARTLSAEAARPPSVDTLVTRDTHREAVLNFSAIVFDFDYTLADSSPGVVKSIDYALHELGLPAAPDEAICRTIGLSLEETLVRLAGEVARPLAPDFHRLFIAKADLVMAPCTTVYDGVGDLLAALRGRGLRVGIVSSKFRRRIETVLGRDGLAQYVDTIVGGEDDVALKPDPEGLQEVMRRLATEPPATLYVGDSVVDAQTAARAGTPFVAVLTGTTPAEAFAQYPSLAIVPRVGDVLPLVTGRDGAGGAGA